MPHCSAFAPCGLLELTSAKPLAETIYDASVASYGGQIATGEGSRLEAHLYAQAIEVAAARTTLLQAGREILPSGVLAMLTERERELGIVPPAGDTVAQRRGVIAARSRLPIAPTQTNVENALRDVLGSDFLEFLTVAEADAVKWPTTATATQLHFADTSTAIKLVSITDGAMPGTQTVAYADVPLPLSPQPAAPTNILAGDVLLVDAGQYDRAETVTVTAAGVGTFTATFASAHDAGCFATTASFPQWQSTKRTALVVTTATAAADPVKRGKVHDILRRMLRGVTTWAITPGGPFVLNQSLLDVHLFDVLP